MPVATTIAFASALAAGLYAPAADAQIAMPLQQGQILVARGRYLVEIGGCNDCHTEGFAETGGKVLEQDWLEGSRLGWHGPWGTSYAVNLRLLVSGLTEEKWRALLHTMQPRPPMPWWGLRWMTPQDQRAVYAFIRHLGPAGKEAPGDLPPGAAPPPPAVNFPPPPTAPKTPG